MCVCVCVCVCDTCYTNTSMLIRSQGLHRTVENPQPHTHNTHTAHTNTHTPHARTAHTRHDPNPSVPIETDGETPHQTPTSTTEAPPAPAAEDALKLAAQPRLVARGHPIMQIAGFYYSRAHQGRPSQSQACSGMSHRGPRGHHITADPGGTTPQLIQGAPHYS